MEFSRANESAVQVTVGSPASFKVMTSKDYPGVSRGPKGEVTCLRSQTSLIGQLELDPGLHSHLSVVIALTEHLVFVCHPAFSASSH